ncbi:MAG: PQQ-binding-like beta-propeller repeat protein [Planctomycetales bacterium]|nr:PQQ-binding-like beta-propeller repeat protein [Planctomycetales bacterium]
MYAISRRTFLALIYFILAATLGAQDLTVDGISIRDNDWPWWRGAHRNGIANSNQSPPTTWSDSENIAWQVKVPGRGHGSPTVWGDKVFLATAEHDEDLQSVVCHDRSTGKRLWKTVVHKNGIAKKANKKASQASASVACDGERVYITFISHDAVFATALTMDGKQVWQEKITDYVIHQGYGSSPTVFKSLLLVTADTKVGGAFAGLDRKTGEIVWRRERPKFPNYMSPVVYHLSGKDQLVVSGCDLVTSLNPLTGETLWEIAGATTECVATTVTDGELIYTSGGYPENHVSAVKTDGSGEVVWKTNNRVYVPSMVVHEGFIYAVLDAGVAACWDGKTGDTKWKQRIGGTFTASLVLVGNHIYATNESGETTIFAATSDGFHQIAKNKIGDEVFASMAICSGQIFQRIARQEGDTRQEYLICIE